MLTKKRPHRVTSEKKKTESARVILSHSSRKITKNKTSLPHKKYKRLLLPNAYKLYVVLLLVFIG